MKMQLMYFLSDVIKREKMTNSILFTLNTKGCDLCKASLKHSNCIYNLLKYFSASGFNIELEEPGYLSINEDEIINTCFDDIDAYTKYISIDNEKLALSLSELIDIKVEILKQLVFNKSCREITMTKEELKKYDGKGGNPAYAAVNGIVYDVTNSDAWKDGVHFELLPGNDLTDEFTSCHESNKEVLASLPVVGKING